MPTTNTYHGTSVTDNYQWLEKADSQKTRDWSRSQNARSRAYFDSLPYRDGIAQQLTQIRGEESARVYGLQERKGRIFALRFKPPAQQPVLIRLGSLFPPALWKPVFDPNTFNPEGTTSMDWFVPSPDGRLVAICLSEKGSEDGTLHFFEVDSGKKLKDEIPRVQYPTGGGSVAWTPDGKGVFYTRYPHKGERAEEDLNFYQQVYFHQLGAAATDDKYEIGRDFPRIAEIHLEPSPDGQHVLATVANGDGGDYAHYLRDKTGAWRQLTKFEDGVKTGRFGQDNALFLLTLRDAPRGKILRVPLNTPDLAKAKVVVAEQTGVIQQFQPAAAGMFVSCLLGGPSELQFFPSNSRRGRNIPTLPISSVGDLQCWHGNELVFGNSSYLEPFAWFVHDAGIRQTRRTALYLTAPVDFNDVEVVREFATSKDGTKVPLNILHKKGLKRDGKNPTLLYGYGGYGMSLSPGFDATRRLWFDAGGVFVIANLRGGGEFGEEWHKAGNLTKKQNVFDDFIASAEHLLKRGYTTRARLAVQGGSNGGLLVGAFLTQRPDLARAVVAQVGIYDMLRVELDSNGQFNIPEFGTVTNPEHFKAIYAYSPYHRVREGVKYPAVLLTTGENDGRVNPSQSRKMTVRLQSATGSDHPILYRSNASAGHGIGTALKDRIAEQADVLAYLFDQLQVPAAQNWVFERGEAKAR
jgi:prolyl oligopeptidase